MAIKPTYIGEYMNFRKTAPKPALIVNVDGGFYAWVCECKYLKVYGNSQAEAVKAWNEAKAFELS